MCESLVEQETYFGIFQDSGSRDLLTGCGIDESATGQKETKSAVHTCGSSKEDCNILLVITCHTTLQRGHRSDVLRKNPRE